MSSFADVTKLRMPALSPTMKSGGIVSWYKEEGDFIDTGDAICEIQTDKASLDFNSTEEGYLAKIVIKEGVEDIPIGKLLGVMVEEEEDLKNLTAEDLADDQVAETNTEADTSTLAESTPTTTATTTATSGNVGWKEGENIMVSPAASFLIRNKKLDAQQIPRESKRVLTKTDVLNYLATGPVTTSNKPAATKATTTPGAATETKDIETPVRSLQSTLQGHRSQYDPSQEVYHAASEDIPTTTMRKIIADRLLESKTQSPHFYVSAECEMDKILQIRKDLLATGIKVSVNDMIIKSVAIALRRKPELNVMWNEAKGVIEQNKTIDISVAVATEGGLITPIVKAADQLTLQEISASVRDLATRGKKNKLLPEEFQGGVFTVSN
eukprot:CAMPEP_0115030398 /NCGR_PEP_ID=MMETSP0216-20121206/37765_1 /TAXON_ID=223996 /ORGANISM="Protocruzia adherens, Strain Boccale" /LENGTH=381 /DNA_ID=CAMNT_0002407551 /DNA_START=204 /DNA_END=1349 /DNA_ORIENTATION=+